jgi:hypothetical protein
LSVVRSRQVREGLARLRDALAHPLETQPDTPDGSDCTGLPFDFLEEFLAVYDAGHRRSRGVFFTPQPLARWIVARLDQLIRTEFGISGGLADPIPWSQLAARYPGWVIPRDGSPDEPFLQLLEPSLGTGVFLDEVIRLVHRRFCAESAAGASNPAGEDWDDHVHRVLLPRLAGLEIMLPACVVAHLRLAHRLAQTGFSFRRPMPIGIHLADTLAGPATGQPGSSAGLCERYRRAVDQGRHAAYTRHATVVLGNPPFSGISQADGNWITGLLQGRQHRSPPTANYYQSEGQPLGERKVWLQDDYVKFLRFAHWKIEQTGCGLIGLITNHGYLDNATFRGVRYQLMQTFPRIDVIDLHGNRKKKEICPDGAKDGNVFGIDQGIAIGLFRRWPGDRRSGVWHRDLWGAAEEKLDVLRREAGHLLEDRGCKSGQAAGQAAGETRLTPQSPYFFFVPRDDSRADEYGSAPSLADIFPIHVTAPVTARDHFVVALERRGVDRAVGRVPRPVDLRRHGPAPVHPHPVAQISAGRHPRLEPGGSATAVRRRRPLAATDPHLLVPALRPALCGVVQRDDRLAAGRGDGPFAGGTESGLDRTAPDAAWPAVQLLLDHRRSGPGRRDPLGQPRQRIALPAVPVRHRRRRGGAIGG